MTELLNQEQRQTLDDGGPVPIEGGAYVVLRADVYEDLRRLLQEEEEAEAELRAFARQARKNAARMLDDEFCEPSPGIVRGRKSSSRCTDQAAGEHR